MILSLLTVGLILTGLGANATSPVNQLDHEEKVNLDEKTITIEKQNEQQTQTTNFSYTHKQTTYFTDTTELNYTTVYYWNQNYESQVSNTVFNVRSNRYENKRVALPDAGTAFIPLSSSFTDTNATLFAFQITPNNSIQTNNLTLKLQASYTSENFMLQFSGNNTPSKVYLTLQIKILQTTSQYASNYISRSTNLQKHMIGEWYNDVKSNIGNNFVERTYYKQELLANLVFNGVDRYTDDGTSRTLTYNFTEEVGVQNQTTNYAFVLIEPRYRVYTTNNEEITPANEYYANVVPTNTRDYQTFQNWQLLPTKNVSYTSIYVPSYSTEVVDIPGIMWEVLTMPFAFVSTAFNLTLFPGTPYQINIANLILMLFGILVFIFLFKSILKR